MSTPLIFAEAGGYVVFTRADDKLQIENGMRMQIFDFRSGCREVRKSTFSLAVPTGDWFKGYSILPQIDFN